MSLSPIEVVGFATGVGCVWLAARENVWNWPVAIVNAVSYVIVFFGAKLYADCGLQLVYVAISLYGWWSWLHGGRDRSELPVTRVRTTAIPLLALVTIAATAALMLLLRRFTDSTVPFWDGLTTAMSLTAQYMLARKIIENWWLWMAADVLYIALYIYKTLYLTAGLYAIFFALCVVGLVRWQKLLVAPEAEAEAG
ncbi:MAG: nicotinamide riboside transporter PnuC [Acidobacteriia bacterium]|nr:nicotinamide riboside transporter PnuC [Terriglobia bacterium]